MGPNQSGLGNATVRPVALEIVIQDLAGAQIAREAGVDRVELCAALGTTGGLTPSLGMLEAAVAQQLAVHPLIRPRSGDFYYDAANLALCVRDIELAVGAGAAGVVVGALGEDNHLDHAAVARFVAAAGQGQVTVHRAVDVILAQHQNPAALINELVDLGVTRVLTSGGKPKAGDGLQVLQELVQASAGRVQIMAGGGVELALIPQILATGVDAVHLSAKTLQAGGPTGPGGGSQSYEVTDPDLVRQAVQLVRGPRL